MNDPCVRLEEILGTGGVERSVRLERIEALGPVTECILRGLASSLADSDWMRFERYLLAAWVHPSRSFTPLLCDVLGRRMPEVHNEDLVGVLEEIADPAAVGALEDALLWEPEWDEFHALGVKCVWALGAIGTPEARLVLEDAASVGPEKIRDTAQRALRRLGVA